MTGKKQKIVLIGPVKPYRGGIAHFNDCVEAELQSRQYEVLTISWRLRYPSFLYPGKSQFDIGAKDEIKSNPKFLLNFYNPITWFKAILKIRRYNPDYVLFNWVTPFLSPILFLISAFTKKKCKNILICHNVLPHERRLVDVPLARLVFGQMNRFVVHAELEREKLLEIKPDAKIELGFHPKYNFFNKSLVPRNIRKHYSIDDDSKIILYFGYVREYKGLQYLIEALPGILKRQQSHLFIVGEIWEGKGKYQNLISELAIEKDVIIIDEYVPDSDVGNYFNACDLVVLPYLSATQSGIAQIAFAFDKPVIITNVGGLKDVAKEHEKCVLIPPKSSDAIVQESLRVLSEKETIKAGALSKNTATNLNHSWEDYIDVLMSA